MAASCRRGVPITTTSQGQSTTQNLTKQGKKKINKSGLAHKSYLSKKPGRISKQCPTKAGGGAMSFNAPGPTQSRSVVRNPPCLKGDHWRKECQPGFHKNGTALTDATVIPNNTGIYRTRETL